MTLFPAHFRDPYFQSKTLLVLLTLAWIVVGYLAEGLQFSLLAMAPHLAMAAVSFKRHHTVMDVLVFLVGTETAFWLIFPILTGGLMVDFVRILMALLCGRTVYALIRASKMIQKMESSSISGFEPVMKSQEPLKVIPENDENH